jgi:hypothetical protein
MKRTNLLDEPLEAWSEVRGGIIAEAENIRAKG